MQSDFLQAPKRRKTKNISQNQTTDESVNTPEPAPILIDDGKIEKPAWRKPLHHHWYSLNRRQKFEAAGLGILILTGLILGFYHFFYEAPQSSYKALAPPAPTTVASPLTGAQVAPQLAKRPVTGIMMENSIYARPQSGIQQAGVVFEAIAEGGITRFLTLYQDATPQYIGPVRSLRPYYYEWAGSFDASVAHVGGSRDALNRIRNGGKDLDEFFNAGAYWRQPTREAPHNVYTSFHRLDILNRQKGYKSSKFTPWPRKVDKKLVIPKAKSINLAISGALYNVHYDYDAVTNSYLRSEGGQRHIAVVSEKDKKGKRLHPKVVIALVTSYHIAGQYSVYATSGKGVAYIFQDGGVTTATWHKNGRTGALKFVDAKGKPIRFNIGQTWITALGAKSQLSYSP
jgi:hypothetical protein